MTSMTDGRPCVHWWMLLTPSLPNQTGWAWRCSRCGAEEDLTEEVTTAEEDLTKEVAARIAWWEQRLVERRAAYRAGKGVPDMVPHPAPGDWAEDWEDWMRWATLLAERHPETTGVYLVHPYGSSVGEEWDRHRANLRMIGEESPAGPPEVFTLAAAIDTWEGWKAYALALRDDPALRRQEDPFYLLVLAQSARGSAGTVLSPDRPSWDLSDETHWSLYMPGNAPDGTDAQRDHLFAADPSHDTWKEGRNYIRLWPIAEQRTRQGQARGEGD